MSLSENSKLLYTIADAKSIYSSSKIAVKDSSKSSETSELDVDDINEELGKGNLDVLSQLEELEISYTLKESANGYTVKYSYNGTNYTIAYFYSEETEEESSETSSSGEKTAASSSDSTFAAEDTVYEANNLTIASTGTDSDNIVNGSEASSTDTSTDTDERFDYTVVSNLDSSPKDLFNMDKVNESELINLAGTAASDIDSGGYDDVLEDLTNIKSQLKDYIKTEIEANGYTYNEDVVDKYLNAYISQALADALNWNEISLIGGTYSQEPTMADIITQIIAQIEEELGNDYNGKTTARLAGTSPFKDSYVTNYSYLFDTADYFLTDDEQKLKTAMLVAEKGSLLYADDETEAEEWIDTYAVRMEAIIKEKFSFYYDFSDEEIDSIIKQAKEETLANANPITAYKLYDMSELLQDFKERCETLAASIAITE